MADRNNIDLTGNLTKDPVRFVTDDGKVRAYTTIAYNPPNRADGTQPDAVFVDTIVRGPLAENVLHSLRKGQAVIAGGRLENVTQTVTQNGRTFDMTTLRFAATKLGPELTFASAEVTKNPKPEHQGQGFGQGQPQQGGFGQGQQGQPAPAQQGGFGQGQQGQPAPAQQGGFGQGQQGQPAPAQQGGFGQGQPQQGGFGQGQPQQGGFGQGQGFGS